MWVKICGITNEEDALLTVALGADALGFVFAPSQRQVTPETVGEILHRLPPGIITVGVFRDERKERVAELVNTLGLGGAQLSGREPMSDVRWIRRRVPFVIQAFTAGDPALAAVGNGPVDIVMVDADQPGSGLAFDWALTDSVPPGVRLLLAGGLHPGNVEQAIRRVRPWGVDVSTGVETTPGSGHKDPRKLRAFIRAARDAGGEADAEAQGWDGDEPLRERVPDPEPEMANPPYDWMADGA
jgi:phosphoribosylanthranilate isomerase